MFEIEDACFCFQKDLQSEDIYGPWNGDPWLCQDEMQPGPPIDIEEISKKIKESYSKP